MTLAEYLDGQGIRSADFAKQIGVHPSVISRAKNGRRLPRWELMRLIQTATDGKVTPNDFAQEAA